MVPEIKLEILGRSREISEEKERKRFWSGGMMERERLVKKKEGNWRAGGWKKNGKEIE